MKTILLKKDIEELRRIYFDQHDGRLFFGKETRKESWLLLQSLLTYPVFFYFTIDHEESLIFIAGTVIYLIPVFKFIDAAKPILKWRRSENDFLERTENTEMVSIRFDEQSFIHQEDEEQTRVHWSAFDHAEIHGSHIWLQSSDTNFILPKKCMSDEDYASLRQAVNTHVKKVHTLH